MKLLDLVPGVSVLKLWAAGIAVSAALGYVGWQVHHQRDVGRDEIRAEWDADRVKLKAEVQAQQTRNLELQRSAEKKYTVAAEVREVFITKTVTEIRHETNNLAACVLTPAARGLLERAAECASEDRPASCSADQQVLQPRPAS